MSCFSGKDRSPAKSDPFDADEEDPSKTNALQSSLWELHILHDHYFPDVVQTSKTLRKPTDSILIGLNLHKDYDSLYKEYVKMWGKIPPTEFNAPSAFQDSGYSSSFNF